MPNHGSFARGTAENGIDIDRRKLLQYKLIHIQCSNKSTRAPTSPVTQAQKGCFCASNGLVTPREEGFAKQTQVMLLEGWCGEDVA
jgi:hypothetical protein